MNGIGGLVCFFVDKPVKGRAWIGKKVGRRRQESNWKHGVIEPVVLVVSWGREKEFNQKFELV